MQNKDVIFDLLSGMHPGARCELDFATPFELLVAVILSAQCTDKRVNIATAKLFKDHNTPEAFAALSPEELKPYIYTCGFFNNKAKNIIAMSKALVEKFGGEVPRSLEELVSLDGVGRKTASVVLAVAFDIPAMPVDTHVFRVSRRIGLAEGNNVEKVEEELKALYPPKNGISFITCSFFTDVTFAIPKDRIVRRAN
jgi:endonuclease III